MIDLSKRKQELYKIKLENGTVLKLKKPTQMMLQKMVEFQGSEFESVEILSELYSLLTEIFNRNANDLEFTRLEIEEMLDLGLAMTVLQDYLESTLTTLGK